MRNGTAHHRPICGNNRDEIFEPTGGQASRDPRDSRDRALFLVRETRKEVFSEAHRRFCAEHRVLITVEVSARRCISKAVAGSYLQDECLRYTVLFHSRRSRQPDIWLGEPTQTPQIINPAAGAGKCPAHLTRTFAATREIDIDIASRSRVTQRQGRRVTSRDRARRSLRAFRAPIYLLCILTRGFSGILINVSLRLDPGRRRARARAEGAGQI